ncbi:M23 family metallopeptidase [Mobilicoccus sp.]|uniref:M23 family metallopeptidase n=1 Tax=Mobilicoccus sp. TaxID=2034349 RepID=UPI002896A867|nr:M23 family metallopeptidase [Mobilicoccus sp.]
MPTTSRHPGANASECAPTAAAHEDAENDDGSQDAARRRRRAGRRLTVALAAGVTIGGLGLAFGEATSPADAARAASDVTTHVTEPVAGALSGHLVAAPAAFEKGDAAHVDAAPADMGEGAHAVAPSEVVSADTIATLTKPGATPAGAAAEGLPPTSVLSPAIAARLDAEARASRATARATLGAKAGFARPVEGTRFTSGFGPRWGRLHAGVDFAGPVGQVVRTVAPGTVTMAGPASGYGRVIEIRHEDGGFTRYGHLHRIDVEVGEKVEAADPIGILGNAGRSTGPHLHFEVRTAEGTPFDPMPWLKARGIVPVENPAATTPPKAQKTAHKTERSATSEKSDSD